MINGLCKEEPWVRKNNGKSETEEEKSRLDWSLQIKVQEVMLTDSGQIWFEESEILEWIPTLFETKSKG